MSCDNILQRSAGLYMYVRISMSLLTHTYIHLSLHIHTQITVCSSVLGSSDMPLIIVAETRSGPTFFTKLERWLGGKTVGPIVAEIFSVKLYTGMSNFSSLVALWRGPTQCSLHEETW